MRSGKMVSVFGVGGVEQSLGRGRSGGLGFVWACFASLPALCLTFSPLKSWLWQALFLLKIHRAIALCLSCRYFEDLLQLKGQSREAGAEFLSWNDIQDSVNNTNSSVQDENDRESCPCGVWSSRGFCKPSRREVALGARP